MDPRNALARAARIFWTRGWMWGTSGNLSARCDDESFWITASGRSKGDLSERDFIRVRAGEVVERLSPTDKPSAETSIHTAIYDMYPDAMACYHVHIVEAALLTQLYPGGTLPLPPLEMIKGLGVWEAAPVVEVPVLENQLEVPRVARELRRRFAQRGPTVPGLLIRNHGLTTWGTDPEAAFNHVELFAWVFQYMVMARQTKPD